MTKRAGESPDPSRFGLSSCLTGGDLPFYYPKAREALVGTLVRDARAALAALDGHGRPARRFGPSPLLVQYDPRVNTHFSITL